MITSIKRATCFPFMYYIFPLFMMNYLTIHFCSPLSLTAVSTFLLWPFYLLQISGM